MKFCKDCKYYVDTLSPLCRAPKLGIDLISGDNKAMFVHSIRFDPDRCSKDAIWFEAKEMPQVPEAKHNFIDKIFSKLFNY